MSKVLTTDSSVLCGEAILGPPPLHGGKVLVESSAKLQVNGNSVLLKSSIEGKNVDQITNKCQTQLTSSSSPCKKVNSVLLGEAGKLTVTGEKVILETQLTGTTDGVPPGTLSAIAEQNKLTAI